MTTHPHLEGLNVDADRINAFAAIEGCVQWMLHRFGPDSIEAQHARLIHANASRLSALAALPGGGVDWVSVSERLPDEGAEVLVYIPDRGDGARFDFDFIEEGGWVAHNERRDHFLAVGGPAAAGPDVACTGPSEDAPYTHWKPLRAPILPTPNPHEADRNGND